MHVFHEFVTRIRSAATSEWMNEWKLCCMLRSSFLTVRQISATTCSCTHTHTHKHVDENQINESPHEYVRKCAHKHQKHVDKHAIKLLTNNCESLRCTKIHTNMWNANQLFKNLEACVKHGPFPQKHLFQNLNWEDQTSNTERKQFIHVYINLMNKSRNNI